MEETKLLFALVLFITAFIASPTFASENELEVKEWLDKNQCQMNAYLDEAEGLKKSAESQVQNFIAEASKEQSMTCSKVEARDLQEDKNKSDKPILVFVSLSMPKESLKSLYKEAEQNHLALIIRGLKNNSFKETTAALYDLGISVQIDPNLFEEYEIKEVPTFVEVKGTEPLKIKGNVSLSYAMKKFEEES